MTFNDQILWEPAHLSLDLYPAAPLVVGRVSKEVPENLISRLPEGRETEPGKRPATGGYEAPELADLPTRPARSGQRITRGPRSRIVLRSARRRTFFFHARLLVTLFRNQCHVFLPPRFIVTPKPWNTASQGPQR